MVERVRMSTDRTSASVFTVTPAPTVKTIQTIARQVETLLLFVCLFVCLFVQSITQKANDPKVFKLGIGNDLGIIVLEMTWFLVFQGH